MNETIQAENPSISKDFGNNIPVSSLDPNGKCRHGEPAEDREQGYRNRTFDSQEYPVHPPDSNNSELETGEVGTDRSYIIAVRTDNIRWFKNRAIPCPGH